VQVIKYQEDILNLVKMPKGKKLSEMTKMDQEVVRSRHKVLDEFWKEKALKNYVSVRNGGPCHWCPQFKPLNFRVCMNCGAVLGGSGAFES